MERLELIPLGTVAPYPKGSCNCPGFLIKYNDYNILLDCGNGISSYLNLPDDLNNLSIFITTLTPDHYCDLLGLLQSIHIYDKYGLIDNNINLYLPDDDCIYETIDNDDDEDEIWGTNKTVRKNTIDYRLIDSLLHNCPVKKT